MTTFFAHRGPRNAALVLAACALSAIAGCSRPAGQAAKAPPGSAAGPIAPKPTPAPAGLYKLDKPHTSLTFRVDHIGMSHFTARFTKLDGTLQFDPAHPEASVVRVDIDPASARADYADDKFNFDTLLRSKELLDAAQFPKMSFASTKVELTGPDTARVTGDLTFRGVTKPVVLETKFNGGYAPNSMDPEGARIGFSAHGTLSRTAFGFGYGVPPKGSTMGVGDEVEVIVETEFTRKPDAAAKPGLPSRP
jgi:polyisoprenoid-binding protein YceI